jgi:hypothetical protein
MSLRKAYYYLYYKLYKFAISVSDDAINEWKPLVTILVLEVLLIAEFFIWYSVATKKIFVVTNPLTSFLPIVAVIGIANYVFFLHRDKWKNYIDEFKRYDKRRKSLGGVLVTLVITLIVGSVLIAFYQLSQIDWTQYR